MSYSGKFKDKNNNLHPVTSVLYGTCDTAAATAAKVVTCADFDTLMTGVTIRVKFDNANTAASPTVNINSTGAKSVYRFGSTAPVDGDSWKAGEVVELLYDGTSFFMVSADDIGSKQDTLTFDDTPTDGSNNPVKSNGIYDALATKADTDIVASDFDATASYTAGNYCVQDGKLYKFKNNHSGAWSSADVDEVKITGELSALKSGLTNVESKLKRTYSKTKSKVSIPVGVSAVNIEQDLVPSAATCITVSIPYYSASALQVTNGLVKSSEGWIIVFNNASSSSIDNTNITIDYLYT